MPRKRERPMPPGGRRTSAGNITLMFAVQEAGKTRRLSQNKILPTEPRSYETVDAAWEGHQRVTAFLAGEIDRAATVRGWWDRWTDEDDPMWGAGQIHAPRRRPPSYAIYASSTRRFVEMFGDRPVSTITELDLRHYLRNGGTRSSVMRISTMLRDAATEGLRDESNPAAKLARNAEASLRQMRRDRREDPPNQAEVDAMLEHARNWSLYPVSLWAWLVVGSETGMRCGELDGMQWKYVNGDVYRIEWQFHAKEKRLTVPKHGSRRSVILTPKALEAIERLRDQADASPEGYVFLNSQYEVWQQSARLKHWDRVRGGTSLEALVGGATMYNATRHHWASKAVNELGISPYQASLLYGHTDGGKLLTDTYAKGDQGLALDAVRRAIHVPAQIRQAAQA